MRSTYIEFTAQSVVRVKEEELDLGRLGDDEAVIRNEASIISPGTELARLAGIEPDTGFPLRPGYGSVGIIEAAGAGITDFAVGDRVFYAGAHASVQRFRHNQGHQWGHLFRVPGGLDPVDASLGCMAEIAMTAPNLSAIRLGDTVAVFGLGIVGLLSALLYKLKGARVVGLDPVPQRCELARSLGLDAAFDCGPERQVEAIREWTGGRGADVCVDAVGHSAVIQSCIFAARELGEILLLGSPRVPYHGDLTAAFWDVHLKGKVVRGAHMYRYPVKPQRGCAMDVEWAFDTVFACIANGSLPARRLISHVIRPEEAPAAYEGLKNRPHEYQAVVIDWR